MSTYCEPASAKTDWETPAYVFDPLSGEFPFELDVCATYENKKCHRYYRDNSLELPWTGICWMNPPYGKEIGLWVKKAYDSAVVGDATVVCLLPVRSNNDWWKWCIQGEIRFIRKKLQFVGSTGVSMFPNAVVIFHKRLDPGGIMKVWEPKR